MEISQRWRSELISRRDIDCLRETLIPHFRRDKHTCAHARAARTRHVQTDTVRSHICIGTRGYFFITRANKTPLKKFRTSIPAIGRRRYGGIASFSEEFRKLEA